MVHVKSPGLGQQVLIVSWYALGMVNVVEVSCFLPSHGPSRQESFRPAVGKIKAAFAPNFQILTASLQIYTRRMPLRLLGLQQFEYSQLKLQKDMEQKLTVSIIIR